MASRAFADASHVESGRSSPGTSSDSDAVNTSTSRVYFGPIQPAERRLARARDSLQHTPIRRSARRHAGSSLSMETLQSDEGETSVNEVVASDLSRPDTPILVEDALEEPASALATKVLRAWDNPSPPPSPGLRPRGSPDDGEVVQMVLDAYHLLTGSEVEVDAGIASDTADAAASDIPTSEQPQGSTASTSLPEDQVDDMDLINFDSFTSTSPNHVPAVQLMPATPPRPSPVAVYSVDDLLASTPLRPSLRPEQVIPVVSDSEIDLLPAAFDLTSREGSASVDEEAQVLIALSDELEDASAVVPSPASIEASEEPQEAPKVDALLEPAPSTPLRRSTRPRRSVSPYFLPLTASPSKVQDPASQSPSPSKVEVGPARRRRSKAKEQDDENRKVEVFEVLAESPDKILADIVLEDVELPPSVAATPSEDGKEKEKESDPHQRLGSLSPASTNLLMQLLPSDSGGGSVTAGAVTLDRIDGHPEVETAAAAPPGEAGNPFSSSTNEAPAGPSTPVRKNMSSQPSHDTTRTPARRIPISQAISEGVASPVKPSAASSSSAPGAAGLPPGFLGAPVFKPRAHEDTMRSPAKRVLISQTMSSLRSPAKPSIRPGSPLKSTHVRSLSEDPLQPAIPRFQRSMSAEPARPSQSSLRAGEVFRRPASTQSIPVRSAQTLNELSSVPFKLQPSIQEMDEAEPRGQVHPSKPQGSLRPPVGKVESKIPRPGTKPYGRPTAASSVRQIPRPTASLPKKTSPPMSAPSGARPLRMVRKVVSKPVEISSGSDDNTAQAVAGPGPSTVAGRSVKLPSASANENGTPVLKRKREAEESLASPPGVRPIVLIRKVPPTQKAAAKPSSGSPLTRTSPVRSPGPTVVQGKIRMRKVVDKKKPKSPPRSPPRPISEPMNIVHSPPAAPAQLQPSLPPLPSVPDQTVDAPIDTTNLPQTNTLPTKTQTPEVIQQAVPPSPVPFMPDIQTETEAESAQELRRTTRSRKTAQGTTDVFGTIAPPRSHSRRRATIVLSDNSIFSGMTALALKSLTTTNTQRNQKQVAEIQMEVILKEGKRPDSPTTKVRTSLEEQREQRSQQRRARAERRARRSGEALEPETAEESDTGDVSMLSAEKDEEGVPLRHRRGPGEEEDYETPERPERPAKRTRLDIDQGENSDSRNERRVKWDRGLATTVYLDDTPPKPKRHPNDVVPKRGALASSAKKLPLDTMGNVLNADAPLIDVRPENIVVKKFVYEDDEPPVSDPPPAPAPAPKPTRSKSKKSRS